MKRRHLNWYVVHKDTMVNSNTPKLAIIIGVSYLEKNTPF